MDGAVPRGKGRLRHAIKGYKSSPYPSLSFWDAMIWATVKEAGVKQLISEDFQNGRELEGVTFINPFELDDPVKTIFGKIHSADG